MRCPTCRESFSNKTATWRPFCSKRCKLVDLGRWLDGSYAIPGEAASDEELASDLTEGLSGDVHDEDPQRRER